MTTFTDPHTSDIRNRPPRIIDLRRIPTVFTGKKKPVDGIIRKYFRIPVKSFAESGVTAKHMPQPTNWKGLVVLFITAVCVAHIATIGSTLAYFGDVEATRENVLEAGLIDFSLFAATTSSTFSRVNCVPNSTITETVEVIPATSTNPFRYYAEATNFSGDEKFCKKVEVTASLNGKKVYTGDLEGLSSIATTTYGTWTFVFTTKVNQSNTQCTFDIEFKAWQTRHNLPSYEQGGFKDLETAHVSLATWGIRINKVYHTVATTTGTEHGNEWIELYNQTNSTLDIGGWKICDNTSCDTIPANTKIGGGKFAVITGNNSTFDFWPVASGVKRIVLADGKIGSGLDDPDMLVLKRSDGTIIDAVNWGLSDVSWQNFSLDHVWNPGVISSTSNPILTRIPTGFDTNTASDWKALVPPTIDLMYPDEGGSYQWTWGHSMNISWSADNLNGPDNKLKIGLYYIKDKNNNGIIDSGDKVGTITESTSNDGEYSWSVPWGFSGTVWIKAVAVGPENPMLLDSTTSGKVTLKSPVGKGWEKFNKFFDTSDGVDIQEFAPSLDLGEYASPLFTTSMPPEYADSDDDDGCSKCTCTKCGDDDEENIYTSPLFDISGFQELIQDQLANAFGAAAGDNPPIEETEVQTIIASSTSASTTPDSLNASSTPNELSSTALVPTEMEQDTASTSTDASSSSISITEELVDTSPKAASVGDAPEQVEEGEIIVPEPTN